MVLALAHPAPVRADQTDARLDGLFDRLRAAPDAETSQPIEAAIWDAWMHSGRDDVDALLATGVASLDDGDLGGALAAFDQVVAKAPAFAEGWNKRATVLFMMGRFADSVADIGHVLALEPRHFGALSGLGLCDLHLDRDRAALDAYLRAVAIDPNLSGVRQNIKALRKRIAEHSI